MRSDPTKAASFLRKASRLRPSLAIVLGSGFHKALGELDDHVVVPYLRIPGFPRTGVAGHEGKMSLGKLNGIPVAILSGRAHYYEGHSMERVTFAVRTLASLGVRDLVLTNAAGGINRAYRAGDFMLVRDHINFMGTNPLRGGAPGGPMHFVDLSQPYSRALRKLMNRAARSAGIRLKSGVYLAVCGPSYETPSEIRAFARLGADAVGMSTVPEAIVARQCGLNVVALSCITNLAAGRNRRPLSHSDVLAASEQASRRSARLLNCFVQVYGRQFETA